MNTSEHTSLYAPQEPIFPRRVTGFFHFFWIEIWPHEFYFVAGLLIMAGLGLFLFTSALGRVWCGYTCPQTVWTDLFILVETCSTSPRTPSPTSQSPC